MTTTDIQNILTQNKKLIDEMMLKLLPESHEIHEIDLLYKMMRDYPSRPSKGLRSSLCVLTCQTFSGNINDVLTTAAALELFQNWILIHDDIEDESELRRGKPVLQKTYGIPLSMNAGDALHGKMWNVLYKNREIIGDSMSLSVIQEFLQMISETTEGQHIELSYIQNRKWELNEDDYYTLCIKKTSWYTCITPHRLGLLLSRNRDITPLDFVNFGEKLGIAFQITDDLLNLSSTSKYGKESFGDIYEGKRTLMLIHLLNSASNTDRDQILNILNKDRTKTTSDVSEVFSFMKKYNSIEYAQNKAKEFSQQALREFDNIFDDLPSSESKDNLRNIVNYMVLRDW